MSELKVNKISALGTGVTVSNPVGINTSAPTTAGDALYVGGNTDIVGAVEVVTVQAENYGVRIKAPANNSSSVLQFTNNAGTQRSFIAGDVNNNIVFATGAGTATRNRMIINGTSGLLSALYASDFSGDANFRAASTFAGNTTFNGQATFNNVAPLCSIIPTLGSHLVNLDYLNSTASKVYIVYKNEDSSSTGTHTIPNVAKGTYFWITIMGLYNGTDFGGCVDEVYYFNAYLGGDSALNTLDHRFCKTGGAGHYYTKSGAEISTSILNVSSKGTVTVNYTASKHPDTSVSYVCLLVKT